MMCYHFLCCDEKPIFYVSDQDTFDCSNLMPLHDKELLKIVFLELSSVVSRLA
jgi:hypothetical protein